jgi:polyisoprenyl-phosphate glycosyltransferase
VAVRVFRIPLVKDATQFMVFSRQALNAILEIKDRYRHIRVFTSYIGYAQEGFEYSQENREGKSQPRQLSAGIAAGVRIIFASTSVPMRVWAWLGVLASLVNLGLVVASGMQAGAGWLTQATAASSAIVLVIFAGVLALLTEYVTTLTEETRNRPLYYIREEKSSSVLLADQGRRNVTR